MNERIDPIKSKKNGMELNQIDSNALHFLPVLSSLPYHHQIPPYGKLGTPYIVTKYELTHPPDRSLTKEETVSNFFYNQFRIDWSFLQKKRLTEQLKKCFPFVYVISHCIWILLNSLIQIALQIALMATNGALWWVSAGIWAGFYFIILALFTFLLGNLYIQYSIF